MSRRMKLKVMANVGPRSLGRSNPPPSPLFDNPLTPRPSPSISPPKSPSKSIQRPSPSISPPKSPSKSSQRPSPSISPPKSPIKSIPRPSTPITLSGHSLEKELYKNEQANLSSSEEAEYSLRLVTSEEEAEPIESLTQKSVQSPTRPRSVSPVKNLNERSRSPTKDKFKTRFPSSEVTRGPGRGPPISPDTSSLLISNIQKEMGLTSGETLKQRLQRGSGSRYSLLRKEFLREKNNPTDKKDLTILHYTFYNPPNTQDGENVDESDRIDEFNAGFMPMPTSVIKGEKSKEDEEEEDDEDEERDRKKSIGPRVKVGPNGELIVDEQSLFIETSEKKRAKKKLEEMETVLGTPSGFYKKFPRRGLDWTIKETVRFYKALTICGTDFSMMAHLFPSRSRSELKSKFKREDRTNSGQVSFALSCQTFDPMESLSEDEEMEKDLLHTKLKLKPPPKNPLDIFEKTTPSLEKLFGEKGTKEKNPPKKRREKCKRGRPKLEKSGDESQTAVNLTESEIGDIITNVGKEIVKRKRKARGTNAQMRKKCKEIVDEESDKNKEDEGDKRPDILRFDPMDPLGLKVLNSQSETEAEIEVQVENSEENSEENNTSSAPPPILIDEEETIAQNSNVTKIIVTTQTQPPSQENIQSSNSSSSSGNNRRSRKINPKIRVPGGGEKFGNVQKDLSETADEIEIEISCQ